MLNEVSAIEYPLWYKYYYYLKIKDLKLTANSLGKYTWEIVFYMVLTGKGRLEPDI